MRRDDRSTRWGASLAVAWTACALFLTPRSAPAATPALPEDFTVEGRLYDNAGAPIATSADFKLELIDENNPTCVLYRELRSADLSSVDANAQGVFSFRLGAVTPDYSSANFVTLFAPGPQTGEGCSITASPSSHRLVRVSVKKSTDVAYETLGPDTKITSVPLAKIAENALSLQGVGTSGLLLVNGTTSLSQGNVESIFSLANFPKLQALLNGSSTAYLSSAPTTSVDLNAQRLTNLQDPSNPQDAATKNYADTMIAGRAIDVSSIGPMTGNNNTLLWDATANKWVAGALNTSPTGAAGGDLAGTYPNPTLANDKVTAAKINSTGGGRNRLLITDPTGGSTIQYGTCAQNEIYAYDVSNGWGCATVAALAPVTKVAGRTGDVTLAATDVAGLGTAAVWDWGTAANNIVRLDTSAALPAVDGSQLTNVTATQLQGRAVASVAPTAAQVLGWNGTAWAPMSTANGTVTSVSAGAGLTGGTITASGTLGVDVGTTAAKILQLDSGAKIPAVDGSQVFNVNASLLATRPVATTNPSNAQVLTWNAATTMWTPTNAAATGVTSVSGGAGLLGGLITATGTLAVDTGTTGGKIVQLDTNAKLPPVDGSQLLNVNATTLATRAVSTTLPTNAQVLAFNATTSMWTPVTAAATGVVNVTGGAGLLGGSITTAGTLNVDVGTTAGKIVQLDGSALLPAVDGSPLYNINASKIGGRAVSTVYPSANYYLGWNSTSQQWEPMTTNLAFVSSLTASTGLLGGTITSTGTIAVDVGTSANKILQLNPVAKIPAVDGSLLYSVNASSLNGRAISTLMPTVNGQVLAWNAATSAWTPTANSAGTVTYVAGGTGLTGGPITGAGTLSVDVGSSAGKIPVINGAAQLMLGDGSAGTPTYSFTSSTSTGFFKNNNDLGFSIGGTQQFVFTSMGTLGIGQTYANMALEVTGTGPRSAILLPRDSTSNRPSGTNGALRYATDTNRFEGYQLGQWSNILSGSLASGQIPIGTSTGVRGTTNLVYDEGSGIVVQGTGPSANAFQVTQGSSSFSGKVTLGGTTIISNGFASNGSSTFNSALVANGTSTFNGPLIATGSASFRGMVTQIQNTVSTGTTIDVSTGNLFMISNACGGANPFTITNAVDGASITIVNTDLTTAKCDFNAGSMQFYFMPANDVRVTNSHTIYNILFAGGRAYVSWSSGFK